MKVFKFKVKETWFGGVKNSEYVVEASTENSAWKKIFKIQGNRDWAIEII